MCKVVTICIAMLKVMTMQNFTLVNATNEVDLYDNGGYANKDGKYTRIFIFLKYVSFPRLYAYSVTIKDIHGNTAHLYILYKTYIWVYVCIYCNATNMIYKLIYIIHCSEHNFFCQI